ncbi:hypothetical protein PG993_003504 [Apiospora rasikravindrae]|uniref:Uncharacterized protein n=1 Tax=Apiospora rasikravindrae TaxID=990691 RepID=A0ABR1TZR4_9PEZI
MESHQPTGRHPLWLFFGVELEVIIVLPEEIRDQIENYQTKIGDGTRSPAMLWTAWRATRIGGRVPRICSVLSHLGLVKSESCGTHVHVSPSPKYGWDDSYLVELQRICRTAVYFERCIDALVPPRRRRSHWCKSHRHNLHFRGHSMQEIFDKIDQVETSSDLAKLMCPSPDGHDSTSRDYKWNFSSMERKEGQTKRRAHTIEFRQPPGIEEENDALFWTCFKIAFIEGAHLYGRSKSEGGLLDANKTGQLEDLLQLVLLGYKCTDQLSEDIKLVFQNFFRDKEHLPEDQEDEEELTPTNVREIQDADGNTHMTDDKFLALFSSKSKDRA